MSNTADQNNAVITSSTAASPIAAAPAEAGSSNSAYSSQQPPLPADGAHNAVAGSRNAGDTEIVLEGTLLKQGSRSRHFWHERYVTFSSDHTLQYYQQQGDAVPKRTYHLPELPELHVSDLYVEKYHGRTDDSLIYCVKLTWNPDRIVAVNHPDEIMRAGDDTTSWVVDDYGVLPVEEDGTILAGTSSSLGSPKLRLRHQLQRQQQQIGSPPPLTTEQGVIINSSRTGGGRAVSSWRRQRRKQQRQQQRQASSSISSSFNSFDDEYGPASPCASPSIGSSSIHRPTPSASARKRPAAFARFRKQRMRNSKSNYNKIALAGEEGNDHQVLLGVRSIDRESLSVGSAEQQQYQQQQMDGEGADTSDEDLNNTPHRPRARTVSTFKKSNRRSDNNTNNNNNNDATDRSGTDVGVPGMVEVNQTPSPTIPGCGGAGNNNADCTNNNYIVDASMATPPVSNGGLSLSRQKSNGTNKTSTTNGSNNPQRPNALTEYERQRMEDLHRMRAEFITSQLEKTRRTNKKLVQGTKIAVAAGAAIGVTIVTAGIGLVAGLVVLGVGAAAGGGGAAVQATWKRKAEGEIVLASDDFDIARVWKACLDASKDSDSIKKSKWGQLFVNDGRKTNSALLPRMLVFRENQTNNGSNPMLDDNSHTGLGQSSVHGRRGGSGNDSERNNSLNLEPDAKWEPLDGGWSSHLNAGSHGLRIFREVSDCKSSSRQQQKASQVSVDGPPCAPMKANVVINTSPLDAFLCLMSYGRMAHDLNSLKPPHLNYDDDDDVSRDDVSLSPNSEQRASFRIIESIDDQTDIIHLVFRPLYLFPSWTVARDYCLFRYWRLEQDGSYIVCFESQQHPSCPPVEGYVRGEMHQVITIAPQKRSNMRRRNSSSGGKRDCLMTAVTQVDPKGWVPTYIIPFLSNQRYADAFGVAALSLLLEVRDAIDHDRFIPVSMDSNGLNSIGGGDVGGMYGSSQDQMYRKSGFSPLRLSRNRSMDSNDNDETVIPDDARNYDFAYANRESLRCTLSRGFGDMVDLSMNPPPLEYEKWAEPDSNSFRVRGPSYKVDRLKINAGDSIGRLIAADVLWSEEPIYSGFSLHPNERIQRALKKEEALRRKGLKSDMPPFIFVVTIILPGPPWYYGVYYFAIDDMSTIDGSNNSPSSKLCNEFLFGDSDEFRDNTFKMIPQIVSGNFIVRKAVGNTPAIMGRKLRQLYVKRDRFFEVILDCGSSSVATGVIGLSLGYAKTLVIDMGFLFEADSKSTLPEKMVGAVRMKRIDFDPNLRKVEAPPPV